MASTIFIVNTIKASRKWTTKNPALQFMCKNRLEKLMLHKKVGEDGIVELEG